jgi:putative protease
MEGPYQGPARAILSVVAVAVAFGDWCFRQTMVYCALLMTKLSDASIVAPNAPTQPELLAPAGDWECARAAVENGADAIYFGLNRFNARMRAHNFTEADLPALMKFLHARDVRGYVTFNTLVFANELADVDP